MGQIKRAMDVYFFHIGALNVVLGKHMQTVPDIKARKSVFCSLGRAGRGAEIRVCHMHVEITM